MTENPHAELDPSRLDDGSADARMLGFAHRVREEMDLRKRRLGLLGYDDLLSHLATALEPEDSPARGSDEFPYSKHKHARAHRRPQAGHLRVPRR